MTTPTRSRRQGDARTAWITGGSLLIAAAMLRLLGNNGLLLGSLADGLVFDLMWLAAMVLFALGIRGAGSVVAGRPLGVAGLIVAGLAPLVFDVLWWIIPADAMIGSEVLTGLGYLDTLLPPVALVIAGVVIAREGAVPRSIRWLPLIAIVAVVVVLAGTQAIAISIAGSGQQALVTLLLIAGLAPGIALTVVGVVAIVHAPRAEGPMGDVPVHVYPPAD